MEEKSGNQLPKLGTLLWAARAMFVGQFMYSTSTSVMRYLLPPFLLWLYSGSPRAATIFGTSSAVAALGQYITLPVFGMYSQHKGRKAALWLATSVSAFGLALCIPIVDVSAIFLLFLSQFFIGISAGVTATNFAVSADVCPLERRSSFVGVLLCLALAAPILIGAGIAFALMDRVPYPAAFAVGAVIGIIAAVVFRFFFEETLDENHRGPWSWAPLNPLVPLTRWLKRPFVNFAFVSYAFFSFGIGFALYFAFFYAYYRFGLSYSLYVPISFLMGVLIGVFLLASGPMIRRFGGCATYIFGCCVGLACAVALAIVSNVWAFVAILLCGTPAAVVPTALVSLIAKHLEPHEQGPFQSYLTSILLLSWFICGISMGPLLEETVYSSNDFVAAISVWICAFCMLIALICFSIAAYRLKHIRKAKLEQESVTTSTETTKATEEVAAVSDAPAVGMHEVATCPDVLLSDTSVLSDVTMPPVDGAEFFVDGTPHEPDAQPKASDAAQASASSDAADVSVIFYEDDGHVSDS